MDLKEFFKRINRNSLDRAIEMFQKIRKKEHFYIHEVGSTYRFFHRSFKMIDMKTTINAYIDVLLKIFGVDIPPSASLKDRIEILNKLGADEWWLGLLEEASLITLDTLYSADKESYIDSWRKLVTAMYTTKIICISTIRLLRKLFSGKLPGELEKISETHPPIRMLETYEALVFRIWVPEWKYRSEEEILRAIKLSRNKDLLAILNKKEIYPATNS